MLISRNSSITRFSLLISIFIIDPKDGEQASATWLSALVA